MSSQTHDKSRQEPTWQQADALVSQLHGLLISTHGEGTQVNNLIWQLHDLLRALPSSGTAATPNIHPEDRDYIVTKLEQRVLAKHGGRGDPKHHTNLSEGESAMHFEAATCIKELVRQLSERSAIAPRTDPVYLIDGKPHRECDCPKLEGKCPRGVERALQTTQLSRCLIPAPDVMQCFTLSTYVERQEP